MLAARGAAGELEAHALAELDLESETFGRLRPALHRGARRPLRVAVTDPRVEVDEGGLRLRFELPRGSYATAVLRELLETHPWVG